jgi:hypothetical protein
MLGSKCLLSFERCSIKNLPLSLNPLLRNSEPRKIGVLQEPIVGILFLGSHAESLVLQRIIAPCLFYNVFSSLQQGHMASDLMLKDLLHKLDSKDVLDFNTIALPLSHLDRNVDVAAHLAFLHVCL